jgi:hypothetical protein
LPVNSQPVNIMKKKPKAREKPYLLPNLINCS